MDAAEPDAGIELPRSIQLLWGRSEPPRRGPKPGLSVDRIVAAAIKIADTDGLGALSMARVANELGYTTMSIYRYVASKDELITLMKNTATGEPPRADRRVGPWRGELERWAHEAMATYRRHPWYVDLPISGAPLSPNDLAWLDWGLAALAGTGLPDWDKLSIMTTLTGYVRNAAQLSNDLARANWDTGAEARYGRLVAELVEVDRFPALHAAIEAGLFGTGDEPPQPDQPADLDADFRFGLGIILDGVQALIDRRAIGGLLPEVPAS